jgi:hypothetical protein
MLSQTIELFDTLVKYLGSRLAKLLPGGSTHPCTYANVTNRPPGFSTRIISSKNLSCIESENAAQGKPDTMQSTDDIPAESQMARTFVTLSWKSRTRGCRALNISAKRGLISIAANLECGFISRRMYSVKTPVPGPYSRTAPAFERSRPSSIVRARNEELGAIAPVTVGFEINSLKKFNAPHFSSATLLAGFK